MRLLKNILLAVLILIVVIPMVVTIAMQYPSVQTAICKEAMGGLTGKINGQVDVGNVYYAPLNSLVVENVVVTGAEGDTVLSCGKVSLKVQVLSLLMKEVKVRKIGFYDGNVVLRNISENETNISRLLAPLSALEKKEKKEKKELCIRMDRLVVDNFRFVRDNPFAPEPERKGARNMNFNKLDISDINAVVKNLYYCGGEGSVKLESFSLKEEGGYDLRNLSFGASLDSTGISISDFDFNDGMSHLDIPSLTAVMENFEALRNFTTEVPLDIEMDQCLFDFRTLHYFSPKVDKLKLQLNLDGNLAGTVDNCSTKGFRVASGTKKTWLDMDFHLIGLPNARQTMATVDVRDSRITTEDLALIISQVAAPKFKPASVSRLAPDEVFKFTGSLNGLFQDFVAYGALNSGIGKANVDIICRSAAKKDYEIIGGMRATDFNLGELLQSKLFGKLDCNASISSYISKNKAKTQLTIEDVNIARIGINNYDYSSISATGTLDYDDFEGKVVCSDPNLKFMLQGILSLGKRDKGLYQFNMALGYADLHALNLDSRELSELQFQADANFARRDGTLLGKVDLRQVKGRNASGHFDIGEIEVHSSSDNSLYRINLNSSFINGRYAGSGNILNLIPDAKSALFSNRLENVLKDGGKSLHKYSGNYYSLDFKVLDVASIATFLERDIHIQNGSSIEIDLDPQGNLKGAVRSPLMALGNNYIQNLAIDIDAPQNFPLAAVIKTETLQSGDIISHGGKIEVTADTNKADVILSMDEVENEISAGGKINFNIRFPERRPGEGLRFLADMGESRFDINSTIWNFYKGSVGYSKEGIAISDIGIFSTSQTLKLDGIISKSESDTLHLQMHDFDAAIANVFVGERLDMQGRITGSADLPAVLAKGGLLADFNVSDMSVAGSKMGNLKFSSLWDEELNHIKLLARSDLEGKRPLDISGWLDPADNTIHGNARIDSLNMGFIDPFLHGILYGISGSISADLKVDGKLDDMKITSKECTLNDFGVTIDYTKVHYTFNGPFSVSEKGVTLNRVDASDDYGNTGIATGGVTWNNFKDIRMDTRVNVRNILALNTEEADNEVFYGKAFATGRVRLAGPFKDLTLYIDATTGDGTVINIPLSSKSSDQNPILVFINPERPKLTALDSLRFAKRQISSNRETESFFNVNLNINATTDAEIQLLIDKDVDNILKARGTGPINIVVDHHNFEIKGDYGVEQGSYKLALLGIVSRDFTINPGGSINFVGDIMKSELNLTASYKTKASIAPLIADTTSVSSRRTVDCGLNITGKLENPKVGFNIDVPDLDPSTQGRVQMALNTEEKRIKQFLTLLLSGSFIPDEQSGIINNTSVSFFNATEIMSNQLNSVLQQLGIPLDLGFNYQPGTNGKDIFDVAVSTQLFNNRVSINGNIGNRQYMTTTQSDVVGDIDVEIKLNKSGKIRLNLFSHSADAYSNYLDQTQRNGAGIAYQEEFDSWQELWRKMFWSRKRREEATRTQMRRSGTPRDSTGTSRGTSRALRDTAGSFRGNIAQ